MAFSQAPFFGQVLNLFQQLQQQQQHLLFIHGKFKANIAYVAV